MSEPITDITPESNSLVPKPEITVNFAEIVKIVANTKIDPEAILAYIDPTITEPQSLSKSAELSSNALFTRCGQKIANTPSYQIAPESVDITGDMVRIGTAAKYILGVGEGKFEPGKNTPPFLGPKWDADEKMTKIALEGIKSQLETAKNVIKGNPTNLPEEEIDMTYLIMAMSYLKVNPPKSGFVL